MAAVGRAVILGCGYTGRRVALRLLSQDWEVTASTRSGQGLEDLRQLGARVVAFDATKGSPCGIRAEGSCLLISIPTLRLGDVLHDPTPPLAAELGSLAEHCTYLSTTGVYGNTAVVNEDTSPNPVTERQRLRVEAERAVLALERPSLVLRPAAIYGPNRGVHVAMRLGRFQLSQQSGRHVSRIHVEDLANVTAAAMRRRLEGAYPVADRCPVPSATVAQFCATELGLKLPDVVPDRELSQTRRSDRRVDGGAVLDRLGLNLRYPTYKEGIRASVAAEQPSMRFRC